MTFACDLTAADLSGAAHLVRHAGKIFTVTVRPEHHAPSRCT